MAAGLSVDHDVVRWMQDRLEAASPDLLREMVKTFAEALMAAEAETLCNAGYRERTPGRANSGRVTSTPPKAVEHFGEAGLQGMGDAGAGGLDHQWLRVAVQRRDNDLLDRLIDGRILFHHMLQARGERRHDAIGEQHA